MFQELPLGNITSANSEMILIVNGLFPIGVPIEMFSLNGGIATDSVAVAETRMSLDGHMVAGYIPQPINVAFSLEPASPSYSALCELFRATQRKRGFYECSITLSCPDLNGGSVFQFTEGVLISGTILPPHRQLMEPTNWNFRFEKMRMIGG